VPNILVSMLVNAGDVIMMTSALELIGRHYPPGEARVGCLVRPESVDLVTGNPVVDQVIVYPYRSGSPFKGLNELRRTVKADAFDLFLSLDRRPRGAAVALLAGIPKRVGPKILFDGSRPEFWTRLLFTRTVALSPAECAGSQVEMFQLVTRRALGIEGVGRVTLPPVDPERDRWARDLISAGSGPGIGWPGIGGPVIGLCVKTNDPRKTWPPQSYAALMARLKADLKAFLYVTGGPSDRAYVEDLLGGSRSGLALNLAGQTSLADVAALAARSDLFLSPDNATAHLVANSGLTPLICLLVGTEPEKIIDSMPRAKFLRFPLNMDAAPASVPEQVELVFETARELLRGQV